MSHEMISPLLKQIEQEVLLGNKNIIAEFWDRIEKSGAPLIEESETDEKSVILTFIYRENRPTDNVVICGSFPGFRYDENRMAKLLDTNIWFRSYNIRNDIKFKYSFSVNDRLNDDYGARRKNQQIDMLNPHKIVFEADPEDAESEVDEYSFVSLAKVNPQKWTMPLQMNDKGRIEHAEFRSAMMNNSRRIWIYRPYCYKETEENQNLVMLMDGFDYLNILSAQNVIDNLIYKKEIPPTVCIFVDNKEDRYEELTCNARYSDFIVKELLPWIQKKTNVSKDPAKVVIGGFSLGGLCAAYIGMKNPDVFGNVLSQSGSFWWKEEWLIKQFEESSYLPLKLYINVGVLEQRPYDDEPIMMDSINKLRDVLLQKGNEVIYEQFQSGHDYLSWGETLGEGLIALVGDR